MSFLTYDKKCRNCNMKSLWFSIQWFFSNIWKTCGQKVPPVYLWRRISVHAVGNQRRHDITFAIVDIYSIAATHSIAGETWSNSNMLREEIGSTVFCICRLFSQSVVNVRGKHAMTAEKHIENVRSCSAKENVYYGMKWRFDVPKPGLWIQHFQYCAHSGRPCTYSARG